jgi:hypothetical protein
MSLGNSVAANSKDNVLCPSARCEDGVLLLGVVRPDGTVAFSSSRVQIDGDFVEIAKRGRAPERRFRFASACLAQGCGQWSDGRCGVADRVVQDLEPRAVSVPRCAIRAECRWFQQRGLAACHICAEIITDGGDRIE